MSDAHRRKFWNNLEVDYDLAVREHQTGQRGAAAVATFSPRVRAVLLRAAGVDASGLSVPAQRNLLLNDYPDALLGAILVARFGRGKRREAIFEVAERRLDDDQLAPCRDDRGEPDRQAVLQLLYATNPAWLREILCRDRLARRRGTHRVLHPLPQSTPAVDDVFRDAALDAVLAAHERERQTLRESLCFDLARTSDGYRVLVMRDHRPAFVARGAAIEHGFSREWIGLCFSPALERVTIHATSTHAPIDLANAIASAEVGYVRDRRATPADTVERFVRALLAPRAPLTLVELAMSSSPLIGGPKMTLTSNGRYSIAESAADFSRIFGDLVAALDHVVALKIVAFDKRVRLTLEPEDDGYAVTYSDHVLTPHQRAELEARIARDHGVRLMARETQRAA